MSRTGQPAAMAGDEPVADGGDTSYPREQQQTSQYGVAGAARDQRPSDRALTGVDDLPVEPVRRGAHLLLGESDLRQVEGLPWHDLDVTGALVEPAGTPGAEAAVAVVHQARSHPSSLPHLFQRLCPGYGGGVPVWRESR